MVKSINAEQKIFFFSVILFLFLLATGVTVVQAATYKVSPDRDVVALNDSFTILFQTNGAVDEDPDFSPLEREFSILGKQKRSNLSITNGKRVSTSEWLVEVMAKRDGKLIIPAIQFGKDTSPTAEVLVKKGPAQNGQPADDETIFIEIETAPEESWVQAQIIYTIRLFRSVNTFNSSLSEPEIRGGKMIVEKLEDRQFETMRNNRRYVVLQRRYALFPQASGDFVIEPIIFSGQISQQSRNLFDPFGRNNRTVQRISKPVNLAIKPVPDDYSGKTWLPAKKVEINEKWMKDVLKLKAGDPVTRTIIIKASGLTSEQLPEIPLQEIEGFKTYPDQPELHNQSSQDGVLGVRQEKSAIIPNAAGEYVLPAVELKWWNTQTNQMELAQLPERIINVISDVSQKVDKDVSEEVADPLVADDLLTASPISKSPASAGYWPWLTAAFALAWFATLFLWWRSTQNHMNELEPVNKKDSKRKSLKKLREKFRSNDSHEIKKAVLVWAGSVWPEDVPTNLAEVGSRCGDDVQKEINVLNEYLYSDSGKSFEGELLLLAIENFDGAVTEGRGSNTESGLKPLYKI